MSIEPEPVYVATAEPQQTVEDIKRIGDELRSYADAGIVEYYLPTIPEGVQYIVGVRHQIVKMSPDQVPAFCVGVTAALDFAARRLGIKI